MKSDARERGTLYRAAIGQTAFVGVLLRATTGALLALSFFAGPDHPRNGLIVYGAIAAWAVVRSQTLRQHNGWWTAVDTAVLFGFLMAEPALVGSTGAVSDSSVSLIIPLVLSFAVPLPPWISFSIVSSLVAAATYGAATAAGSNLVEVAIFAVAMMVLWAITASVRMLSLRACRLSDAVEAAADAAQLAGKVVRARRRSAVEQWALLHDTAASTMLMVSQGAVTDRDRLTAQAQRDLRALGEFSPDIQRDDFVDLKEVIEAVCAEFAREVARDVPKGVRVPAYVARAVSGATREALTNVERHARAANVRIEAASNSVTIVDDGVGYSPDDDQLAGHFGVRNSVIGRMRRAGGDATIRRGAESGTVVELTWPTESESPSEVAVSSALPMKLVLTINFGIAIIGLVVLIAHFAASQFTGTTSPTLAQLLIFGILCVVGAVVAVAVFTPMKWIVVAGSAVVLLVAGPLFTFTLAPDEVLDTGNWPLAASAWMLTALLFLQPLRVSYPALAGLWALQVGAIVAVAPTRATLVEVGHVLIVSAGTQFLILVVLGFVARAAHRSRLAEDKQRALADIESVRTELAKDHEARCRKLSATVIPLLTGFAENRLDPDDAHVRARAAVEASRLRRMVAQADESELNLSSELQPALERAEDRGVAVTVDLAADLSPMPAGQLRQLVEVLGRLLDAAASSLRLVVMPVDGALSVSVVGDLQNSLSDEDLEVAGFTVTATAVEHLTWVRIREQTPASESTATLAN